MIIDKLITNNPVVQKRLGDMFQIEYLDVSYLEILHMVRNYIHMGHKLITHPLSGSIKPNETPFKSVVMSQNVTKLDFESLSIIEESIVCYNKFELTKQIPKHALEDFMEIDCSLITSKF